MKTTPENTPVSLRRLGAPLGFVLAMCLLVVFCYDSGEKQLPSSTGERYAQAKAESLRAKGDDRLAGRRDTWESLARVFTEIYDNDSQWPNRPAALFRAAESLEELASRFLVHKDAERAAACYEKVAKAHPKSQLADDALYRAAHIRAARLGDDKAALKLLERLKKQYAKGDMLELALTLEKAIQASSQGRTAPEARKVSRAKRDEVQEESVPVAEATPPAATEPKPVVTVASLVPAAPMPLAVKTTASTERPNTPSKAQNPREKSELQVLSWDSPNKNSVEIVLEMSAPAHFSSRLLKSGKSTAASVVLDMENVNILKEMRQGAKIKGSLLTAIRVQEENGKAQLFFDFRDVRRFDTRRESDPCRIVLAVAAGNAPLPRKTGADGGYAANEAAEPENKTVAVAEAKPVAPVGPVKSDGPVQASEKKKTDASKNATPVSEPTPVAPKAVPTPRPDIRRASITSDMASQLGLSVQRVFIDAGHGGRDPGTSHNNVLERIVTHDVAQNLGRLLRANGFEVVFSRSRDSFVSLSERTARANEAHADLFVSIHVNANEDKRVQGLETYFLDIARNRHAARVAALENAGSDHRLGDMQDVLAEVMLNARVGESRNLAQDVQRATLYRLKKKDYIVRDSGVKSAPFHVLIGAQMPAVLVELGYCSNREEATRLQDAKYRESLAEGLAEGIMAYQKRLQNLQTASR